MSHNVLTVLVIDDNPADSALVQRLLAKVEGVDYEVIHALSADEGLIKLSESRVECIILDYVLGEADGIDVLRRIRAEGIDIPIVTCTGSGSESVAIATMKEGAQDYLVKGGLTPTSIHRAVTNSVEHVRLARLARERQEELASFVAVVSHDLRAPIRHIIQLTHFIQEESDSLNESVRSHLKHLSSAGLRMNALVSKLVEYANVGRSAETFEPVALDNLVSEVVADLGSVIQATGAVVETETLPVAFGDAVSLRQLFQNLIANGIKYNRSTIPSVVIRGVVRADETIIEVTDNGIGIEEQFFRRIFEPLKRLHAPHNFEGSGLGLATAERIVKHHGGRIWVKSDIGKGSTFFVALPSVEKSAGPTA